MRRKKKWIRPKLIVIVKGRPEEYALVACKTGSGSGAGNTFLGCQNPGGLPEECFACNSIGTS